MIANNLIVNGGVRVLGDLTVGAAGFCYYGTCETAADAQAKVASINGDFLLKPGAMVNIKFTNTNTFSASSSARITLNVNNTGAKNIYATNGLPTGTNTTYFGRANYINTYVYDGSCWIWVGASADNNSTYANYSFGNGWGTCATAAATAAKEVTFANYSLVTNGICAIKFTYAVPANATLNINTRGAKAIRYRGAAITADVINAGDIGLFVYDGTYYELIAVDHNIEIATVAETKSYLGIS